MRKVRALACRVTANSRAISSRDRISGSRCGAAQRDVERLAVEPEHGAVQEAERAAVLVDAGARELALAQQVQQVALDLLGTEVSGLRL